MDNNITSVLLVDDDRECLFFHKYILRECGLVERMDTAMNGQEAILLIENKLNTGEALPQLLFLDINMPVMDGWEFLEQYNMFPEDVKSQMKLVMLSASANPDDEARALSNKDVWRFCQKNLTIELTVELLEALHESVSRV